MVYVYVGVAVVCVLLCFFLLYGMLKWWGFIFSFGGVLFRGVDSFLGFDSFRGSYNLGGFCLFFDLVFFIFWGVGGFLFWGGLIFWGFLLWVVFGLPILNCFYSFFWNSLDIGVQILIHDGVNDADRWRWSGLELQFWPEVFNSLGYEV